MKLLPCPFCGSEKLTINLFHILCNKCATTGPFDEQKQPANKWNQRKMESVSERDKKDNNIKFSHEINTTVNEIFDNTESKKIFPCKKCGKIPQLKNISHLHADKRDLFYVNCHTCSSRAMCYEKKESAIKVWNRNQAQIIPFHKAIK